MLLGFSINLSNGLLSLVTWPFGVLLSIFLDPSSAWSPAASSLSFSSAPPSDPARLLSSHSAAWRGGGSVSVMSSGVNGSVTSAAYDSDAPFAPHSSLPLPPLPMAQSQLPPASAAASAPSSSQHDPAADDGPRHVAGKLRTQLDLDGKGRVDAVVGPWLDPPSERPLWEIQRHGAPHGPGAGLSGDDQTASATGAGVEAESEKRMPAETGPFQNDYYMMVPSFTFTDSQLQPVVFPSTATTSARAAATTTTGGAALSGEEGAAIEPTEPSSPAQLSTRPAAHDDATTTWAEEDDFPWADLDERDEL
eukprot:GHVT01002542.1.p1 GENE.GHVT01002542.1~~GHVT01002542.1.p1  ORF type:complete len:307 (+),score=89.01 GHVT01002542.1:938-1858(+)